MGLFDRISFDPISAVASVAGSMYAADQSKKSAREQMAFQERMSGSAHQREVSDLRKAGLNPILSATGGQGASSPSGAGYEVDPDTGSKAVASAREVGLAKQQVALMKAQEGQANSAQALNVANSGLADASADKARAETAILSPQKTLFKKLEEGMSSGASTIDKYRKGFKDLTAPAPSHIIRTPLNPNKDRSGPVYNKSRY